MDFKDELVKKLILYGVGKRKLDDELFQHEKLPRLGIYDIDDEKLCHELVKSTCNVPGCKFTAETILEFETHYNACHRYSCAECKKVLPSPHLLDLHIQEKHDSFFAVMAARKPPFCCYIEECKEKFLNPEERLNHCVKIHKLPKDFRFDQKPKLGKAKGKTKKKIDTIPDSMELDSTEKVDAARKANFTFSNSKTKTFAKYTGRKFTNEKKQVTTSTDVNMDEVMDSLKESLPK